MTQNSRLKTEHSSEDASPPKGRGAVENPGNRFDRLHFERDEDASQIDEAGVPATEYYRDETRSIITRNDSPDVGFSTSLNPYRGCEHGCI